MAVQVIAMNTKTNQMPSIQKIRRLAAGGKPAAGWTLQKPNLQVCRPDPAKFHSGDPDPSLTSVAGLVPFGRHLRQIGSCTDCADYGFDSLDRVRWVRDAVNSDTAVRSFVYGGDLQMEKLKRPITKQGRDGLSEKFLGQVDSRPKPLWLPRDHK